MPLHVAMRALSATSVAAAAHLVLFASFAGAAQAGDIKVVATIKPIHALVAGVMDGVGTPELLVAGSASPHTFALKPSGARALNDADVVFRVSAAVEPFTVKIVASLPERVRVVTLADAPGVKHLAVRRGATFEADAHGHDHDGEQTVDAAHSDGHVWLDPENAKAMVNDIVTVLAAASPTDGERLRANAARVKTEIDALDREIATSLTPLRGRAYVVFHDAYQYFETRYGLSPAGATTIGPDVQPGAKRLSELRAKIANLAAVCVFAEPQFSSNIMHSVTSGTAARFGTLDPEGALVAPGPGAYAELMRNLARNLQDCLDPNVGGG